MRAPNSLDRRKIRSEKMATLNFFISLNCENLTCEKSAREKKRYRKFVEHAWSDDRDGKIEESLAAGNLKRFKLEKKSSGR